MYGKIKLKLMLIVLPMEERVTFEGKQIVPGDIRYKDVNNDGVFDKDNDRDYLGSPTPKLVFGMTNTLLTEILICLS